MPSESTSAGRPGLGRSLDEPAVAVDEIGPPGVAQAGPFEDDPVEALEAEVCGEDRHPLAAAVLVEQGCRHGDRRTVGERRGVDVLDGRMGGAVGEERLIGLRHALVLGQGRQPDLAVEVQDEDLLGVGGIADDRLEVRPKPGRGVALRVWCRRRVEEGPGVVAEARDGPDIDDVAGLLVDPALE